MTPTHSALPAGQPDALRPLTNGRPRGLLSVVSVVARSAHRARPRLGRRAPALPPSTVSDEMAMNAPCL